LDRIICSIARSRLRCGNTPARAAAAEGAACAQLQSSDAFWAIHDQIFDHQHEVTPSNVKEKLVEYAQAAKSLDQKAFHTCVDNAMSLGLVFRDMDLAAANGVDGTPTVYINGHRVSGIKDADQFRKLIAEVTTQGGE
jgi:protein-disulfide isomerase